MSEGGMTHHSWSLLSVQSLLRTGFICSWLSMNPHLIIAPIDLTNASGPYFHGCFGYCIKHVWIIAYSSLPLLKITQPIDTVKARERGGGTPILKGGTELPCDWPPYWPPLSAEKKSICLYPILFKRLFNLNKICHLTILKHFIPIFSLIFDLVNTLFHCS